jgi:hypothetical protein
LKRLLLQLYFLASMTEFPGAEIDFERAETDDA